ncbi:MAG: TolB-like 6-bladed beta-propeller domain-containing protein [Dysgonamonadaceae bacterium]|jgi:hypothetical protein|nr:TolB-like 6-bladed beta-propeller domain-containing protein [Dysgonamonadaceae bacterium]
MNKLLSFFLILGFYACADRQVNSPLLDAEVKTVESRLYESDLMIKYCDAMDCSNSCIYLSAAGLHQENIAVRETDGKEIGSFGRRDQGPGEYIAPIYAGHSENKDTIYVWDMNGKLYLYSIQLQDSVFSSSFAYSINPPESKFYQRLMRLKNGCYVGLPLEEKATDSVFVLLDSRLNKIKKFGRSPVELKADYRDFRKCFDNARITVYGNKIFLTLGSFAYIAGYEITDSQGITTLFEKTLIQPVYHSSDGYIVFDKEKNREGFYDIAATDKHIFTVDKSKPDGRGMEPGTFMVFDHQGNLISRIKMNHEGARICVSEDEKTLYHCVRDPNFDIASYKIEDMLK